eukprot:13147098-Alexandrium_andersonii.AAC.2
MSTLVAMCHIAVGLHVGTTHAAVVVVPTLSSLPRFSLSLSSCCRPIALSLPPPPPPLASNQGSGMQARSSDILWVVVLMLG